MALEADPTIPLSVEEKQAQESAPFTSAGKYFGVGVIRDIGGAVMEGVADFTGDDETSPLRKGAKLARTAGRAIEDTIPERDRKAAEAAFFPEEGQQSVTTDPLRSLAFKTTRILPQLGAAVLLKSVPAQIVGGALQQEGQFLAETANTVEKMTHEELQKTFPRYEGFVQMGLPEDYARKLLVDEMQNAPGSKAIAAAGGVAGAIPVGRALHGPARQTVKATIGHSAAETAAGVGVGGGTMALSQQLAEIEAGKRKEIDWIEIGRATANATTEGAILGTALGTGRGVVDRVRNGPVVKKPTTEEEQTDPALAGPWGNRPNAAETAALEAGNKPADTTDPSTEAPTALDAKIAAANAAAAAEVPSAPVTPPGTAAAPAAPAGPPRTVPLPTPTAKTKAKAADATLPPLDIDIMPVVHAIAMTNTRASTLLDKVNAHLESVGEQPLTKEQLFPYLRQAVKNGEMVYNDRRGYRSVVKKAVPVEAPVAPPVEPPVETPVAPPIANAPVAPRPTPEVDGLAATLAGVPRQEAPTVKVVDTPVPSPDAANAPTATLKVDVPAPLEPEAPVAPAASVVEAVPPAISRGVWRDQEVILVGEPVSLKLGVKGGGEQEGSGKLFQKITYAEDGKTVSRSVPLEEVGRPGEPAAEPVGVKAPEVVSEAPAMDARTGAVETREYPTRRKLEGMGMTWDARPGFLPDLKEYGFTPEQIALLEKHGLATNGKMSEAQWNAWNEAMNGLRKQGLVALGYDPQPPVSKSAGEPAGVKAPVAAPKTDTAPAPKPSRTLTAVERAYADIAAAFKTSQMSPMKMAAKHGLDGDLKAHGLMGLRDILPPEKHAAFDAFIAEREGESAAFKKRRAEILKEHGVSEAMYDKFADKIGNKSDKAFMAEHEAILSARAAEKTAGAKQGDAPAAPVAALAGPRSVPLPKPPEKPASKKAAAVRDRTGKATPEEVVEMKKLAIADPKNKGKTIDEINWKTLGNLLKARESLKRQAEARAKAEAEAKEKDAGRNANRPEGAPRVLTAKKTDAQLEAEAEATRQRVLEEAKAKEAERKRTGRAKSKDKADQAAQKTIEDVWEAEAANPPPTLPDNEGSRIKQLITRVVRLAAAIEEAGITLRDSRTKSGNGKAGWSADNKDGIITPWVNFAREIVNLRDKILRFEDARGARSKSKELDEALTLGIKEGLFDFLTNENHMRNGDYEAAAASRKARNAEKTMEAKEAARTTDEDGNGDPNFDKKGQPINAGDVEGDFIRNIEGDAPDGIEPDRMRLRPGKRSEDPNTRGLDRNEGRISAPDGAVTSRVSSLYFLKPETWAAINAAGKKSRAKARDIIGHFLLKRSEFDATLDADYGQPVPKGVKDALYKILERLHKDADDIDVVFVKDGVLLNEDPDEPSAGFYMNGTDRHFKAGYNGLIVLGEGATMHAIMHEVVHAVTSRAIRLDPKFEADIKRIMRDVQKAWGPEIMNKYGMLNPHEFLSEAMTNPFFQATLQETNLTRPTITRWGAVKNAWGAIVARISEKFGFTTRVEMNALDAAMRAFEEASIKREDIRSRYDLFDPNIGRADFLKPEYARRGIRDWVADGWEERKGSATEWKLRGQRVLDKVMGFTQLGNTSDNLYGPNKPARTLSELMGRMARERDTITEADAPLVRDLFSAQRKYEASGAWGKFEDFLIDQTQANVYGDRPLHEQNHLGKDSPDGWYGKEAYSRIKGQYDALPPELQQLSKRLIEYYKQRQNDMSLSLIKNILKAASEDGRGSDALAQRIHEGKMTDADRAVIGGDAVMATLAKARQLAKVAGPYVPLMRRGDFVVTGKHTVATPGNALRRMNDVEEVSATGNVFEFKNEADARAFMRSLDGLHATAERVYIDPATGSSRYDHVNDDGKVSRKRISSQETNAEQRVRVTVQDRHVEFFERPQQAKKARAELIAKGLRDVTDVDMRDRNAADVGANFVPTQIQNMINALEKRTTFKNLEKGAQQELVRHLHEMGIAAMSSTRAQTRRLPRTNVAGASHDITTNTQQYSSSTAGYLARLKYQPQVDATLKEMQSFTKERPYDGNGDDTQLFRKQRLREFEDRVYNMRDPDPPGLFNRAVSRLLQISYLDKLASPAFHIINAQEPWTVSMPVIGGRHGMKTVMELQRAYSAIGAGRTLGAGIKDTIRAVRENVLTDQIGSIRDRLAKQPDGANLVKMFDHLVDVMLVSKDAGMELSKVIRPDAGLIGRGFDRADHVARQLGSAIEAINRSVTAVAAYRLEFAKTKSHDAAVRYATETVHDTMGDYNSWNAPPIFNHPLGRIALQFRKYAQKTYYLLGKQAVASLKGDPEAMKAFAGLMGTHMLVAGALGLPLEAIRMGMLAAGMAGVTDKKYSDLEQGVRKGAANVFGVEGGQIFTRGLPRYLGWDLAGRMGMDSLLLGSTDPKSMKQDDLYAYFAKAFAGAPTNYILDAARGFQELGKGNVTEASRLIMPLKVYADSIQAYQMYTEGRKSEAGRQMAPPVTGGQALSKVLGFQPGAVAEQTEKSMAIRGDQQARKKERDKLIGNWVTAQPADKLAMLRRINEWNKDQPKAARIEFKELTAAQQRRKQEDSSGRYDKGIRYTKRDIDLKEANSFYNVR